MSQLKKDSRLTIAWPGHVSRLFATLATVLALITMSACSKPPILLDHFWVKNATPGKISDVHVRHEPTLSFGAVNFILPESSYEIAFPKRPMQAKQAVVDWRDDTGRHWSVPVALPKETGIANRGQPLSLVYEILPEGQVAVRLQPSQ